MLGEKEDVKPICVKPNTGVDKIARLFLEGAEELHEEESDLEEKKALLQPFQLLLLINV